MDVYIVLNGRDVVAVSARLQGAEVIRADEATRIADAGLLSVSHDHPAWQVEYRAAYDHMRIEHHRVRDVE